jgi:Mitochondrial protein up-regulated during meiosis
MTRTLGSMRKLPITTITSPFASGRSFLLNAHRQLFEYESALSLRTLLPSRSLAQVRQEPFSELWFTPSRPARSPADDLLGKNRVPGSNGDHKPPDERSLKLGKSKNTPQTIASRCSNELSALRTLSPLLPNILTQPLPPSILSPTISLHLFPSTHHHLPAVKGKVPYRAALWTAPVAWGCVPIVGNVKLHILSEKIVRTRFISHPDPDDESRSGLGEEKLVVRWKTEKKKSDGGTPNYTSTIDAASSNANSTTGINRGLSTLLGGDKPIFNLNKEDEFSGMFIFTFDSEGRIATHTIEHADESHGTDKTSRVVTVTDWLLGRAKWRRTEEQMIPGLAMNVRVCREEWAQDRNHGSRRHPQLQGRW